MKIHSKDYVKVIYNEIDRPLTQYPQKLTAYLVERFGLVKDSKILDVGCGRGEFLLGFINCGLRGHAVDQSSSVTEYCPEAEFKKSNIELDGIPYPDNFFDVVYSKSVIEHFFNPEKLVNEIYRVLKPGGRVITMCPSWEYNYRTYFEDYTHRTPFMIESLRDIKIIQGFKDVEVEFFYQLPSAWGKSAMIIKFCASLTRYLVPSKLKKKSKWIRFSKEIMLLSTAKKPELSN